MNDIKTTRYSELVDLIDFAKANGYEGSTEKLNKVLVAHHNGITIAYYYNNSWIGTQSKRHYLSSVTHWMPLPERP